MQQIFWGGFLLEGKLLKNDKKSDFVVASRALKWWDVLVASLMKKIAELNLNMESMIWHN